MCRTEGERGTDRRGVGDLSHFAGFAIPTAPIIPFIYPRSLKELIYLQLTVVERLSSGAAELEYNPVNSSLSSVLPLCYSYHPVFTPSLLFSTVDVDLS